MPKDISVIESFETDLNELIDNFESLDVNANFNGFAKLWKSKRFYLIFHGVLHVNQLHEFLDEIFDLCFKKLQTEHGYLRKVALFYVIYACYFKQPDKEQKFNIRLHDTYLKLIRSFIEECKQNENYEVPYCWCKLLAAGAFDFVFQINHYGPWFIRRQNYDRDSIRMNTVDEQFNKRLEDLDRFQIDYDKLKVNIEEGEGKEEIETLDLIDNKSLYINYLKEFENLKQKFDKSLQ